MKILFISTVFPNMKGGIADYTYNLLEGISRRDVEMYLLTSDAKEVATDVGSVEVINTQRSWRISEMPEVLGVIRRISPDIIHVQHDTVPDKDKRFLLNLLPLVIRIMHRKIRVVITVHEFREHRLRWKLRTVLGIAPSHALIMVDDLDLKIFREQFPVFANKKTAAIPIASNIIPEKNILSNRKKIRKELGFESDDIIFFHFGMISRHKGVDKIIEAFERAMDGKIKGKLVIISDMFTIGHKLSNYQIGLKEKLRTSAHRENIITLPGQSAILLSKYLIAADIGVFPFSFGVSFQRGSFLACIAHGLPVITAYKRGYMPQGLADEENVVLVETAKMSELSGKMILLAGDKMLRQKIGKKAFTFYEENFSWDAISAQTVGLYKSVVEGKNK